MASEYLAFTARQEQVLKAPFPSEAVTTPPQVISAHGATGAGKSLATLAGFVNWATVTRRHNHFIVIVPHTFGIRTLMDRFKSITDSSGELGGLNVHTTNQWIQVESNYFHFYPYHISVGYDDQSLGAITFKNFIPEAVYFWAADLYEERFVDHVMSQVPDGAGRMWASMDAHDPDNYWYTKYIGKQANAGIVAVEFDIDDVADNPGVSDRWRGHMLEQAGREDASIEVRRRVTGKWLPGPQSILSGLGGESAAEQEIKQHMHRREQVARAQSILANATLGDVEKMQDLSMDATIARSLPYPYVEYETGDKLVEKVTELLSDPRRDVRNAALGLVIRAGLLERDDTD